MKKQHVVIFLMTMSILISACGQGQLFGPRATDTPTPTLTPLPTDTPTFSLTPTATSSPTATLTNTATLTSAITVPAAVVIPKPGHWEGTPAVSFDLSSDGQITNFIIGVPFGTGSNGLTPTCTIKFRDIPLVGNSFIFNFPGVMDTSTIDYLGKIGLPTPVVTQTKDGKALIDGQQIIGTFISPISLQGTYLILICDNNLSISKGDTPTWTAAWKQP